MSFFGKVKSKLKHLKLRDVLKVGATVGAAVAIPGVGGLIVKGATVVAGAKALKHTAQVGADLVKRYAAENGVTEVEAAAALAQKASTGIDSYNAADQVKKYAPIAVLVAVVLVLFLVARRR